ncbi:MAG TPA: (d)CMP kinase [Methylophilus sp.]|nr:(d)CMP kinase [Methylophilus sp.]HQQ32498.1 (d)CMP kinase [Methylophilus sp.]
MKNTLIPVIAIDGPSASGKGTISQLVAETLGFHYLDSGALYRVVAFAAKQNGISWADADALANMTEMLDIRFEHGAVFLGSQEISQEIRSEAMGKGASEVSAHPQVRSALTMLQQEFAKPPGLVADGRDMGSVIFPDAVLKIFLTASAETRAERRYKQLLERNVDADYTAILQDLQMRDKRDSERSTAPLVQTPDALLLDTSHRTIDEAVDFVLNAYKNVLNSSLSH